MLLASTNASWHCCHIKAASDGFELDEGSALTGTKWTFKSRFAHGKWYFQHSSFRMKAPGSQQIGGRNCPAQSTITSSFDKAFSIRALRRGSCARTIPVPCSVSPVYAGNVERRQVTLLLVPSATKTKGLGSELEWWGDKDSDGMMDRRCDVMPICRGEYLKGDTVSLCSAPAFIRAW